MNRRYIIIIVLIGLALLSGVGYVWWSQKAINADTGSPVATYPAVTVYGVVKNQNGALLKDIVVSVGNRGVITNVKGEYFLAIERDEFLSSDKKVARALYFSFVSKDYKTVYNTPNTGNELPSINLPVGLLPSGITVGKWFDASAAVSTKRVERRNFTISTP